MASGILKIPIPPASSSGVGGFGSGGFHNNVVSGHHAGGVVSRGGDGISGGGVGGIVDGGIGLPFAAPTQQFSPRKRNPSRHSRSIQQE